jgi:hypothetical protein
LSADGKIGVRLAMLQLHEVVISVGLGGNRLLRWKRGWLKLQDGFLKGSFEFWILSLNN